MKILYGVPGEGMGHSTRSKVVIEFLLSRGHDVRIVSSSRAYQFLARCFPGRVTEINGLHLEYKNAILSNTGSLWINLKRLEKLYLANYLIYRRLHKRFEADLVISDFENFSHFYGKINSIPVISIDNIQVLNRCRPEIPIEGRELINERIARLVVRNKVPGCKHYFITSFFDAPVVKSRTSLVKPIIRDAILNAKPTYGKEILVYQTSDSFESLHKVLSAVKNSSFVVYGMNRDEVSGNVRYRKFSEDGFIRDLAGSAAIIANGGFSLLSEAVYLRKPVFSFPIRNQFEQFVNASYIQKLGYGLKADFLDSEALNVFLGNLDSYRHNLSEYSQNGNQELFGKLSAFIPI